MQKRIVALIVPSLVASKLVSAHDHLAPVRRRQDVDYVIDRLALIQFISSTFQLPISQLDEARISENCKGEEDGGYRAPANRFDSTQCRCATRGRWFSRLVGLFNTFFDLTILNTWHLAPRPHIKLPYGKVETSNVASVLDFVQANIVTARPTEGVVSRKVFGREISADTVDYSEDMVVFTTLPPRSVGDTLDDEPDNWTECILAGHMKRRILSTPGFPRPVKKTAGGRVNHRVRPSPFGGLGMFATRPVRTGDLIVAERPLLISQRGFEVKVGSGPGGLTQAEMIQVHMQEWEEQLGIALKRMTDENRKAFMALANSHTEDGSGPILGIIRTNGYKVPGLCDGANEDDNTRTYTAVLNVMSRINHR